jgi:hypothetical protein
MITMRVCTDCGKPVVPCQHTQSRGLAWDHASDTTGGPCEPLLSALNTVELDAATVAALEILPVRPMI